MPEQKITAEYIWIDGKKPTAKLRSKTKVVEGPITKLDDIPKWSFDGSSTDQAEGNFSDCLLKPVYYITDSINKKPNILVMCEVLNPDGIPHESNTRTVLRKVFEEHRAQEPIFGYEQEYTLYRKDWPLGWPRNGFPHPQGRYYCGVGYDEVYGRPIVEEHLKACLEAGLSISGVNAEVMPAQWEFQVGPLSPLEASDQMWLARWILYRLGEEHEVYAKLDPKPMPGDWNGAGCHTNFSTKAMREEGGIKIIEQACERLGQYHKQHIKIYGADNDKRLTGKHETCSINEYRWGVADRGASVRVPVSAKNAGRGYLEDRRPAANLDPYQVCTALIETICGQGFDPDKYGWGNLKQ
ncbi:MAG: glutamine synthetase [Candidatus Doudnabacteria bacterium CG10_big_fil_rev_8_21_14_0_10_41_10]|uniref:glutamine synthetase n=1 Tax=Candidatus Doudnabacteria bacterium CG10_big_fil_rev_8_21_14_0_10_41_10 TaxID=1974551 RepID=A0A2H0VEJ9_9BACT|nr:MAG: glutamine synthetase [Candidatus Doudnabacteria bacterium CG10_big_fil_rev_8_21_14_0_10_41_10]